MKTKKILILILMFLFITTLSIVIPNNVFAIDEMSDEFKRILNEESKLVITDTTMQDDKTMFLWHYLNYKYPSNEYAYNVYNYNEETSTCNVEINITGESHTVEFVYEEEYSDKFSEIFTDGKVVLPTTSKNMNAEWIESYVFSFGDDNYLFNIATEWNAESSNYDKLMTDDMTKATIIMSKNGLAGGEQHIVEFSKITEQSENFKKYLNKDGKIEINAATPSNEDEFLTLFEMLVWEDNKGMYWGFVSDDFKTCDFTVDNETHTVGVEYNYDSSIKTKLQGLEEKFPDNIENFKVRDLELVNYWVNAIQDSNVENLAGYSSELKSYLNGYNVKFKGDSRAGYNECFKTGTVGFALFTYSDVAYFSRSFIGAKGEHVLYVPENTGDSKEELVSALQKRINEYTGNDEVIKVSYFGSAQDALVDFMWKNNYNNVWSSKQEIIDYVSQSSQEEFEEMIVGVSGITHTTDSFLLTINNDGKERTIHIFIKKDNSKMLNPTHSSVDLKTEIGISTESSDIPLDSIVDSMQITSGSEYERIIKVLDVEDNATYDINLFSDSLGKNITKLENGKFEVKIPIPEELEGKTLIVYYVDSQGNVTEHEVVVKDGFAIFETDHFSIYTLAEKQEDNKQEDNKQEDNKQEDNKQEDNKQEDNKQEDNKQDTEITPTLDEKDDSPKTGTMEEQNSKFFVCILIITLLSLTSLFIMKRKA